MSKLKRGLWTALKWSLYPLFYVCCLLTFFYLTFPWDRVKDRIIAEFAATQSGKGSEAQRLEIGEVSGHWITGVELEGVKLIIPPSSEEIAEAEAAARRAAAGEADGEAGDEPAGDGAKDDDAGDGAKDPKKTKAKADDAKKAKAAKVERGPKDTVVLVERATGRVQILPLLLGRVQVKVDVEAFGGEIAASVPIKGKGGVELALSNVDLGQIPVLKKYLGVPLRGVATGTLDLTRGENGKLSRSVGALDLSIEDAIIGDGKTKIAKLITLPPAKLGKVEIAAEAEAGTLKVTKFGATGGDLELTAEGQSKIKDKWRGSTLDLYLRFKFSDEYRSKDDKTKLLFGEPGSKIPGMIDTQPKIKRAKRGDDSYGIHVYGSLRAPKYEPWTSDEAGGGASKKKRETTAGDDEGDDDDDEGTTGGTAASKRKKPSKSPSASGARKKPTGSVAADRPAPKDEPVQEIEVERPPEPPAPELVEAPPPDVIEEPLLDAPPGDAPPEEAPPTEEVAPP